MLSVESKFVKLFFFLLLLLFLLFFCSMSLRNFTTKVKNLLESIKCEFKFEFTPLELSMFVGFFSIFNL